MTDRSSLWPALLLTTVGFMFFMRALPYPYVYDDFAYVVDNRAIRSVAQPLRCFTDRETQSADPAIYESNYRPLTTLSFAWVRAVTGENPFYQRLLNLILHLFNGLLVFRLTRRILPQAWPAAISTAIFLLHPLQIESVIWISCRSNLLAGLFCFLTLALYLQNSESKLAWITFLFGLFSKEWTTVLPGVMAAWRWFELRRKGQSVYKNLFGTLLPFAFLDGAFVFIRFRMLHALGQAVPSSTAGSVGASMRLALNVTGLYASKLIFPFPLSLEYAIGTPQSWLDRGVIAGLLSLAAFLGGMFVAFKRSPIAALGMIIFSIGMLPYTHIIPLKVIMADRFLYFSLFGISIVFIALLERFSSRWTTAILLTYTILLVMLGLSRINEWRTPYSLYASAIRVSPKSAEMHLCLGAEAADIGNVEEALGELETAIAIDPQLTDARLTLARTEMRYQRYAPCVRDFEIAFRLHADPSVAKELANAYRLVGSTTKAESFLRLAIAKWPLRLDLRTRLAEILLNRDDVVSSARLCDGVLELDPFNQEALRLRARAALPR